MHIMVWAAGESRKKNHTSKVQESRLYFFSLPSFSNPALFIRAAWKSVSPQCAVCGVRRRDRTWRWLFFEVAGRYYSCRRHLHIWFD